VTLIQFANAFAIAITFARWRRRSEAIAVPDGTNFYNLLSDGDCRPTCNEMELCIVFIQCLMNVLCVWITNNMLLMLCCLKPF